MDASRNLSLAPNRNLTFDATSHRVRDQDYGEQKLPSRFSSVEQDRLARYTPSGSAAPARATASGQTTGTPIDWSGRDAKTQHNVSGPPGSEAFSNDPNEAFANELNQIPSGNPISGINAYNKAHHAARTSDARDKVERIFRDWRASYDARGGMNPFAPRQAVTDMPWSGIYEANSGGRGAGLSDPNKLQIGQELSMPGGGTHTVAKGETLSGIAAGGGGGSDLGSKSLAAESGGVEPSGGGGGWADPGGKDYSVSNTGSSGPDVSKGVPVPPEKPSASELGSSPAPEGTPTPPSRPSSLGGGAYGSSGGDIGNATNPNEAAGQSFLKSQGIGTGDGKKPRRGK